MRLSNLSATFCLSLFFFLIKNKKISISFNKCQTGPVPAAAHYLTVLFSICVATWREHFFPLHFFGTNIPTLERLLLQDPAVAVWLCFIKWDEIGCWGKKKMPKKKLPTKSTNSQLWIYVRMLSKTFQRWTCCKHRLIISTVTSFCIQFCLQ